MLFLAGLLISLLSSQTPTTSAGTLAWDLCTKMQASGSGRNMAVRYWRQADDSGPHVGRIWSASGVKLAEVAFIDESASGWQEQALAAPLSIAAGDTFIVCVNSPAGAHYAIQKDAFTVPFSNGPLAAPVNAGMYGSQIGAFPALTTTNSYFRDVVWEQVAGPSIAIIAEACGDFVATLKDVSPGAYVLGVTLRDASGAVVSSSLPLTVPNP